MKQKGTLVGATVRVNDDQDIYPVVVDNEIKGGKHSVSSIADRDAIPAERRSPGMECYVFADGNTYELANDLVTWTLLKGVAGGSTDPGTGGDSDTVALISGNFGAWTDPGSKSSEFVNENFPIQYKADLLAFPTRAIIYLQGQFELNSAFVGTTLTLGNLPANCRPQHQLKKYLIASNIELFLVIETNGDIKIESKDGLNLPVTDGTPGDNSYYVDCFFNPSVTTTTPTTYTTTRTENFTRNNCPSGDVGSVVSFSRIYSSTISQGTADSLAASDPNFEVDGQNNANSAGTCTVDPTNNAFVINNRNAGNIEVLFLANDGTRITNSTLPGQRTALHLDPSKTYTVSVENISGPGLYASVNSSGLQFIGSFDSLTFVGALSPTIAVSMYDNLS